MAHSAPGKHWRKGLSLVQFMGMIPDEDAARKLFEKWRWPDGPFCPYCGSHNVQCGIKHKSMTHRCRDCRKRPMFSLRTRTVMQGSHLGYREWLIAMYLQATNLKSVSSMKLHRDLGICQKTAWHLAHRIREAWKQDHREAFKGAVEVDETYLGGKRKNMHKAKRRALKGRGPADKTVVVGIKSRNTNAIRAKSVTATDGETLQSFITSEIEPDTRVFTDDHRAYKGMPYAHEAVNHSAGEYVRGRAHTQGIESFWAMLKRGYHGTFHHFSEKHTDRYVAEFAGRHSARAADTDRIMGYIARNMVGRRLKFGDLIAGRPTKRADYPRPWTR